MKNKLRRVRYYKGRVTHKVLALILICNTSDIHYLHSEPNFFSYTSSLNTNA